MSAAARPTTQRDGWHPRVTVACVAERGGQFLMIEERVKGTLVLNQPAGHWDHGESLAQACARETLEETGYVFRPEFILGTYIWDKPGGGRTFLRTAFGGTISAKPAHDELDDGIERVLWMSADEIAAEPGRLRSPMVLESIRHWQDGVRHPMDLIQHL